MKRGRWMFRDEEGKLHKFNTQEEAAKAKGLVLEKDYAEEEEIYEEDDDSQTPSHYDWLKDQEKPEAKES